MNKKKDLIEKILANIFTIDGFAFIVCFIIAPIMHTITGKAYVGGVIFCIGLFGYAVNYFINLNKKYNEVLADKAKKKIDEKNTKA